MTPIQVTLSRERARRCHSGQTSNKRSNSPPSDHVEFPSSFRISNVARDVERSFALSGGRIPSVWTQDIARARHRSMVRIILCRKVRNPNSIGCPMTCGVVASLLDMDIDTLAALVELEQMGLIARGPSGSIELNSLVGLEAVAEGHGHQLSAPGRSHPPQVGPPLGDPIETTGAWRYRYRKGRPNLFNHQ